MSANEVRIYILASEYSLIKMIDGSNYFQNGIKNNVKERFQKFGFCSSDNLFITRIFIPLYQ